MTDEDTLYQEISGLRKALQEHKDKNEKLAEGVRDAVEHLKKAKPSRWISDEDANAAANWEGERDILMDGLEGLL